MGLKGKDRFYSIDFSSKRITVTGASGFLGSFVIEELKKEGAKDIFTPSSAEFDLTTLDACKKVAKESDIIIHLAAKVGGIGANMKNPGSFFYDNLMMGVQLIEQARFNNVEKFVAIGTICAYPKFTPVPFKESELWNGYPEETNAPYGLAKKMLLVQLQAYKQQYNFNGIYLLPVNLYGPRDNFDPSSSHVIPALIRKISEAKKNNSPSIVIWGDGSASREFLF
ncbi:MAG: NAD-dependent epimerase/dehydratase family protein, partial [Candidatus Izemoplasmatales bacterium]|nr:NAD-dependent epimerase/dehydratase family protein [Candidatus Izemoplasmatales bacterium]